MEKRLEFKQNLIFFAVPLTFDLLFLVGALFLSFPINLILGLVAVIFAGVVVWQSRPFLKNYELTLTPKFLEVRDFRKNLVRKIEWNKVEAAAAGYKKSWLLYTYSFYFRVKGDEDLLFGLITRQEGLTSKFQQFMKVFVRKRIPVQVVKGK
ncbi:hypothetical protein SAMN06269117_12136 [Balnearium lithotrophicum]|uniref:Uncharacterized protein n=1 Tax=Balnearium lithotrophicum TaxID=223788 RepID=A0A521DKX3_9BACT|nr:hypothetical protein [Balnearium lithotrophicum]SMO71580.1 hypothetical protein SAMN06269117_12136 [Balnearium lithotrophicum]